MRPQTTPAQETILLATLDQWARETFDPVRGNCALSVHAYAEQATGITDPAPRDLGLLAKATLWADEEALERYCARVWRDMGLAPIVSPWRGDIGLLRGVAESLVAGICLGKGKWALRGPRGLVITGLEDGGEIVRAWTFYREAAAIGKVA